MTHFPIQEWRGLVEELRAENQQQRNLIATLTDRYDQEIACNAERAEEIARLRELLTQINLGLRVQSTAWAREMSERVDAALKEGA